MIGRAQKLNTEKYENAILYFLKYCNNQHLGSTKLNKLLYYLDFISYRDRKESVTGDNYVHKRYGPIPANVDSVLGDLTKSGSVNIKSIEIGEGKDFFKHELLKQPDIAVFEKYEIELLDKICKEFSLWSTDKIVDQTHLESPWLYSKPFEEVNYDYASDIEFFPK